MDVGEIDHGEQLDNSVPGTFHVSGMSCEHCVAAVTQEVSRVPGVETVAVDLASGTLTVTGPEVDPSLVAEAVTEAGYELH